MSVKALHISVFLVILSINIHVLNRAGCIKKLFMYLKFGKKLKGDVEKGHIFKIIYCNMMFSVMNIQ